MTQEERKAAKEALAAILKARAMSQIPAGPGGGGIPIPPGLKVDVDVDPDLLEPKTTSNGDNGPKMKINDPDNVLKDKNKNNQGANNNQQSGSQQGGQESGEDQPQGGSQQGSDGQNQNGSQDGSSQGGSQSGEKQDGKQGDKQSGQGGQQGEKGEEDAGGPGTPDYNGGWNKVVDQLNSGEIDNIRNALDKLGRGQLDGVDPKNQQEVKGAKDALGLALAAQNRKLRMSKEEKEALEEKGLKIPANVEIDDEIRSDEEEEESEEDKQARIDRINDPSEIEQDIEDIITDVDIRQGDITRAKEDEKRAIAEKNKLLNFADFETDLFDAVRSQIGEAKTPDETYLKVNPTYADSDLLMPGMDYPDVKMKPIIYVYVDQSGSFDDNDIKVAEEAISTLWDFERRGKIETRMFFFANHVFDNPRDARREGGTHAFPDILRHINDSDANNIIVLSDADFDGQTNWQTCGNVGVRGCVWWLWRYGNRSWKAPEHLRGELGNFQYKL